MFDTDINRFDLVEELIQPGNILEIGTHHGGSAARMMRKLSNGFLVTVDPWGSKPYMTFNYEYSDELQKESILRLAQLADELNLNWHHFKMESIQFLTLIQPLGCWYNGVKEDYMWQTVLLDGDHSDDVVLEELQLVYHHVLDGGMIVIDNVEFGNVKKIVGTFAKEHNAEMKDTTQTTSYLVV